VRRGSRVAVVAPASPFDRAEFDRGVAELARLGLDPVFDDSVFERKAPAMAGSAPVRAAALTAAWAREDVDAIVAVRGGYGSVETLPLLDRLAVPEHPATFVGYSDVTSLHIWLNIHVGATSVHGAMLDRRLARGTEGYDPDSFLRSLGSEPVGELAPDGVEVLTRGDATGVLLGGTITQLAASLGTPYAFKPPIGSVLFLDEVGERPYRLHRLLTQLRLAEVLSGAAAIVIGQLPQCDEPGGRVTARAVVEEFFEGFAGPVLFGFPSGHTVTPLVSIPFGVEARVVADGRPRLVIEESAAV
jgi:muramoyltetrapeptide carboxypeptidase